MSHVGEMVLQAKGSTVKGLEMAETGQTVET